MTALQFRLAKGPSELSEKGRLRGRIWRFNAQCLAYSVTHVVTSLLANCGAQDHAHHTRTDDKEDQRGTHGAEPNPTKMGGEESRRNIKNTEVRRKMRAFELTNQGETFDRNSFLRVRRPSRYSEDSGPPVAGPLLPQREDCGRSRCVCCGRDSRICGCSTSSS